MTVKASKVIAALQGKTLATAESCTGGMIGAALTSVSGASAVYRGGIISYVNDIKEQVLGVVRQLLEDLGPVSAPVAQAMAEGARRVVGAQIAVSVTGLAGPGGDAYGNEVGTVYIGYSDPCRTLSRKFLFQGDREAVRRQAADAALDMILEFASTLEAE